MNSAPSLSFGISVPGPADDTICSIHGSNATIAHDGATRRTPATAEPASGPEPGAKAKAKKKELQDAQRRQRDNLKRQIRRSQSRITAVERKRRTRRLILMGSYLEHVTGDDPGKRDRLMKGLDGFLERDRDRGLFDLPPNKEISDGNPG